LNGYNFENTLLSEKETGILRVQSRNHDNSQLCVQRDFIRQYIKKNNIFKTIFDKKTQSDLKRANLQDQAHSKRVMQIRDGVGMMSKKGEDPNIKEYKFDTKAVHSGQSPDETTGAIVPPIYATATYVMPEVGKSKGHKYARVSNPTRTIMEDLIADLEESRYGVAFSSGMAAIDGVIRACLKTGDHLVVGDDVYGGVYRLFEQSFRKYGLTFSYVDTTDSKNVEAAIQNDTRLIWLETPTNPLLKITDLNAISDLVQRVNQQREPKNRILIAIDNTFMSPYFLQPFKWGVDIVVHSTTKYLSGHDQLIGGIAVVRDDPSRWYYEQRSVEESVFVEAGIEPPSGDRIELVNTIYEDLKFVQKTVGSTPSPFDCWLTILGVKTLSLRMKRHEENAREIVGYLIQHPKVEHVYYPGLEGHKNHAIAKQQMTGFGGMVSFEIKGGLESSIKFMNNIKLWSLAVSLGAVESLVTHPATQTHSSIPRYVRLTRGIKDGLVRLSVGIEDPNDLIADLKQALEIV